MVTLIEIDGGYVLPDRKRYLLSSPDDVDGLPTSSTDGISISGRCSPGSIAYTPDLVNVYMLGNDDIWHEIQWEKDDI